MTHSSALCCTLVCSAEQTALCKLLPQARLCTDLTRTAGLAPLQKMLAGSDMAPRAAAVLACQFLPAMLQTFLMMNINIPADYAMLSCLLPPKNLQCLGLAQACLSSIVFGIPAPNSYNATHWHAS